MDIASIIVAILISLAILVIALLIFLLKRQKVLTVELTIPDLTPFVSEAGTSMKGDTIIFDDNNVMIDDGVNVYSGIYAGSYVVLNYDTSTQIALLNTSGYVKENGNLNLFNISGLLRRRLVIDNQGNITNNQLIAADVYISSGAGDYLGCYGTWVPTQLADSITPRIRAIATLNIPGSR